MTDDQRKIHDMYRREYIVEQFRGQSRFELIERIRELEKLLAIEEKKPEPR